MSSRSPFWRGRVMYSSARGAVTALAVTAVLFGGVTAPAQAGPAWNKSVHCQQKDWDGRVIPTRVGNSELGWRHLSGPHNIKKCSIIDAALNGKPDKIDGPRLEYWAYAWDNSNSARRAKVVVIVQYARKTADGRYSVGAGQKVGVITAYCAGTNRCPNWLNQ